MPKKQVLSKEKSKRWLGILVQCVLWALVFCAIAYTYQYPQITKRLLKGISLPNIKWSDVIQAAVFLLVVLYAFRFLRNLILKWLERHPHENKSVYYSMIKLLGYIGWIIGLWGSLSLMGLNLQNLAIIFGALSVGIGFGLQTIVNNFVSGLLILFERPISVGDWIRVAGQEGIVKNIRIRATELETFDKTSVLIPNASILSSEVVNVTRQKEGRVIVNIGVSYDSDMEKVRQLLMECAKKTPGILPNSEPMVLMTEFGDNSVNFEIRVIIQKVTEGLSVRSELMFSIWNTLEKHHIEIPFPQRVVHLKK